MYALARPSRLLPTAAILFLALGACASSGRSGGRVDPGVITLEELDEEPGRDLLTTIRSLRPRWLQVRASGAFGGQAPIAVIIDGQRQMDGVGALHQLRASQVQELRRLSAADATTRYGLDMTAGAIVVTMRR